MLWRMQQQTALGFGFINAGCEGSPGITRSGKS
jgi:hypothetical protein